LGDSAVLYTTAGPDRTDNAGTLSNVVALTTSDAQVCTLSTRGEVLCFSSEQPPTPVVGVSAVAIGTSSRGTCAVRSDATVACWNFTDEAAPNALQTHTAPSAVTGLTGVSAVTGSCALRSDGTVWCWDRQNFSSTVDLAKPHAVAGLRKVRAIAEGGAHACALLQDGLVACWGKNGEGQLGDGSTSDSAKPVSVVGLNRVKAIAAGLLHTCALQDDGAVKCWGNNASGQLGRGTNVNSARPVSALPLGTACYNAEVCRTPRCGDLVIETFGDASGRVHLEDCEDGNARSGDGCDSSCQTEPYYSCDAVGAPCTPARCGDGARANYFAANGEWILEDCDDGNAKSGDGCSAACKLEPGFACPDTGACRMYRCGDGLRESNTDAQGRQQVEACDDGNTRAGDGCSPVCAVEPGYLCTTGQPCRLPRCGDGIVETYTDANGAALTERCDDGNAQAGDGCSSVCSIEQGWHCSTPGQACRQSRCGDGMIEAYTDAQGTLHQETCDNGNATPGDGCSADCRVEAGWACGTKDCKANCAAGNAAPCTAECSYDANRCFRMNPACNALLSSGANLTGTLAAAVLRQTGDSLTGCKIDRLPATGPAHLDLQAVAGAGLVVNASGDAASAVHFTASGSSLSAQDASHLTLTQTLFACVIPGEAPGSTPTGHGTLSVQVNCDTGSVSLDANCQADWPCSGSTNYSNAWRLDAPMTVTLP